MSPGIDFDRPHDDDLDARIEAQLSQLSTTEKIQLTSGDDFWRTHAVPSRGIPCLKLSDGPSGARGGGSFSDPTPAALFPSSSCLGATFDRSLAYRMGNAIACDSKSKQVHLLLGPTINMVRDPRNGRSFETYSEDPLLCGALGGEYVLGVQDTGVGACLKHFVANEAEHRRRVNSSNVDETTLRTVYLRPFQIALARIREAHRKGEDGAQARPFRGSVASIMTAYNRLNRVSCSENDWLYNRILRDEWRFGGLVVSDWLALHNHGLKVTDLEMPGPSIHRKVDRVLQLIKDGVVTEVDIDRRAAAVLRLIQQVAPLGFRTLAEESETSPEIQETADVIRQIAAEGAVLLRNSAGLLPLDPMTPPRRIALIGRAVTQPIQSGGGSANLKPQHVSSLHSAVTALLGDRSEVAVAQGCETWSFAPPLPTDLVSGIEFEWYSRDSESGKRELRGRTQPDSLRWDASLNGLPPLAREGKLDAKTWSITASFDLQSDRDMDYVLQYHAFGRLTIATGKAPLVFEGEKDPFEYLLHPHHYRIERRLHLEAGRRQRITFDYEPVRGLGAWEKRFFSSFGVGGYEVRDPKLDIQEAASVAASSDLAVVLVSTGPEWESEGFDRETLCLPRGQNEMVRAVLEAQPNTVVVTVSGAAIELPFLDHSTVVHGWFGGQESGSALCDVLFGQGFAPASGRMPHTWAKSLEDIPAASLGPRGFPGIMEDDDDVGPNTYYDEALSMGYRHFETRSVRPTVWFGGGLAGYTRFTSSMRVRGGVSRSSNAVAEVTVRNVGQRSGKEVVQIYLADAFGAGTGRSLVAFDAVRLAAGKEARVELPIRAEMLSRWCQDAGRWKVRKGWYDLVLAKSADPADEVQRAQVEVQEDWDWRGLEASEEIDDLPAPKI
ncbi:uncharacterized protein PFL1_05676 [Pseudozyma flocculosa PF-1]|uniref:beta-glucosidase n=2 Tax=Pseudozyma flocculosa TaxID=84751 RepID=A0A5C3F947_9BASI|nr:uncharacterized protein PFL1_05676 [Pseudozyma flocculosa PF-1]EPQ26697.1 hypothetical protein PFL1_05676 [Pseudozyma flocculosa PF-1]SPO40983.1 uncharacterized protein PSFLO_06465 [Pseudozyma flocculosa]